MAVYSFLDEVDLTGKTVIPVVTSGGSGFSGTVGTIAELEPGAAVREGLSVGASSVAGAQERVEEWLAGLQPAAGETTEDRRAALGAKWRASADKCGIEKIRAVCGSWNGVAAEVTYDGLAAITVLFRSWTDMPGNMDSVRQSLRAVIPAHLRYEIIAQLLRQAEAMTQLAAAGTHAKHYGEHEVTL